MISFPNAKINLGLEILNRREDGYHNICSLFYPVNWCDVLEIIPASKFSFQSSGLTISGNLEENLCVKAYRLLQNQYNLPPVAIHLHKIIPMGAGLGGGSADASFTLMMLNDIFNLNLSPFKLMNFAGQLGSDCAFFVQNTPSLATNKGDDIHPVPFSLAGKHIIIIYANIFISSAKAYANIKPRNKRSHLLEDLNKRPIQEWQQYIVNDFEKNAYEQFPILRKVIFYLHQLGADYISLTGSGSAIYGIFKNKPEIKKSGIDPYFLVWSGTLN